MLARKNQLQVHKDVRVKHGCAVDVESTVSALHWQDYAEMSKIDAKFGRSSTPVDPTRVHD